MTISLSTMSGLTPVYLLDKNVIRKTITAMIKAQVGRELTREEGNALDLLEEARREVVHPFIGPEAQNLLQRFRGRPEVDLFLEVVEVMQAGRYFKRWARRLQGHGFTREDAKLLSLGAFGTRATGDLLGADAVVTLDQALINNFLAQRETLQERFEAMTANLPAPFCFAVLPPLIRPATALESLK